MSGRVVIICYLPVQRDCQLQDGQAERDDDEGRDHHPGPALAELRLKGLENRNLGNQT